MKHDAAEIGAFMRNYKNLVFWSWNGKMDHAEMRRQIADFKAKELGGFFIHARAGLKIDYLSDEWFSAVRVAIGEADAQGLEVWLYDENGWPSGFGSGAVNGAGEDYQLKTLKHTENRAEVDSERLVACFKKSPDGYEYCTDAEGADLFFYYAVEPNYVDLLNPNVTKKFIETVHERYRREVGAAFGKTIKGIFTDEPQLSEAFPFSPYLREAVDFEELWKILDETDAGFGYRIGYFKAVKQMFRDHYTKQIYDWCAANGLIFTGHFAGEDGLCRQMMLSGGVAHNYEYMQMPGIDFLGRRLTSLVLMKQISGMKRIFDKKMVLSETFGCTGWGTSLAQLFWIWGYQAVNGVNRACLHLSAYSIKGIRKRDYPTFFSYQQPWWKYAGALNEWMEQVNRFASLGESVNDILVLSPLSTFWGEPLESPKARECSAQFRLLLENLTACQLPYDVIDEDILNEYGKIEGAEAVVLHGRYSYIIVPKMLNATERTYRFLYEFASAGGTVLVTASFPQYTDGIRGGRELKRLTELLSGGELRSIVQNRAALWAKCFRALRYRREVSVLSPIDMYLPSDITVQVRKASDAARTYCVVYNQSTDAYKKLLLTAGESCTAAYVVRRGGKKEALARCGAGGPFVFTICPMQTLLIELGVEEKEESALPVAFCTETIVPQKPTLCDKNTLTIDYARMRVDGEPFSALSPVVRLYYTAYDTLPTDRKSNVCVEYEFECSYLPDDAELCIESEDCERIVFNEMPVESADAGWWLDKSIRRFPVAKMLKKGKNKLELWYSIEPNAGTRFDKDVFETEKNRFFTPAEIENVYLRGTFDVAAHGRICETAKDIRVDGCFTVERPLPKCAGELTVQGLWFYRGSVSTSFSLTAAEGEEVFLRCADMRAACAEVYVQDQSVGVIACEDDEVDLTPCLSGGEATVRVEYCSTNRNTLGPHHHCDGETIFTGLNIFRGTKGYEDTINDAAVPQDTFTDRYSFVRFDCGKINIIRKRR